MGDVHKHLNVNHMTSGLRLFMMNFWSFDYCGCKNMYAVITVYILLTFSVLQVLYNVLHTNN